MIHIKCSGILKKKTWLAIWQDSKGPFKPLQLCILFHQLGGNFNYSETI